MTVLQSEKTANFPWTRNQEIYSCDVRKKNLNATNLKEHSWVDLAMNWIFVFLLMSSSGSILLQRFCETLAFVTEMIISSWTGRIQLILIQFFISWFGDLSCSEMENNFDDKLSLSDKDLTVLSLKIMDHLIKLFTALSIEYKHILYNHILFLWLNY